MYNGQSNQIMLTGERIKGDEDIEAGRSVNNKHDVDIDKWASSLSRILEDVPHYMCTLLGLIL